MNGPSDPSDTKIMHKKRKEDPCAVGDRVSQGDL